MGDKLKGTVARRSAIIYLTTIKLELPGQILIKSDRFILTDESALAQMMFT
jgi:hypothetical protein